MELSGLLVGAFLAVAVLVFALVLYAKIFSSGIIGVNEYRLYSNFEKAQGLHSGTKVQISGVDIGHVSSMTIDASGMVRMEFTIRREYQDWITDSARIYAIRDQNVISERVVNVDIRNGKGRVLSDGDFIVAGQAQDIETVLETVNQVLNRVTVLINQADTIVSLVKDTNTTVGALLGSKTVYEKLNMQLDRLDRFSYTGTVLLDRVNQDIPVLLARSDTITRGLSNLTGGLQNVPQKLDHTFATVDTMMRNIGGVVDRMNGAVGDLSNMSKSVSGFVQSGEETMGNADDLIQGISNMWIIRRSMPKKDSVPLIVEERW
jgi:phospholipid/cholesterol/gamma-HCH transport system substrate-binding protein